MQSNASRLGLAAVLLVSGFLLASALPSSLVAGHQTTVTTTENLGRLAVEVLVQDSAGVYTPAQGDVVVVSQQALHGVQASLRTNATGEVEIPVPPGRYVVTASELRFQITGNVSVSPGELSEMRVDTNRTAYGVVFADLQDLAGSGLVEPWEQVSVALANSIYPVTGIVYYGGGVPVGLGQGSNTPPKFGQEVFLETSGFELGGSVPQGAEVPAQVLSQGVRGGETWLRLQPSSPLDAVTASSLSVVTYSPSYTVVYGAP
jgi:hypothetical protein